jgi:NitT/TauT family transport system substrate-binding protein
MISTSAVAQTKVTIAVGGGACLCYLPTVLAKQLGEYEKAGLSVELVDLKGGSDALKAVLGGSADVVSGYFDHCVNLAAKKQELVSFVVYDRYPGEVLLVAPAHTADIKSIKDLAGKKVGVSAPGSSTDFFLKFLLKKNGIDPASVAVIGVGLGATAVAAVEQGQIDALVTLDPSATVLQGNHPDLRVLADTRTAKDTLEVFGGEYPGGALYSTAAWVASHDKEAQALTNAILATLVWIRSHSAEEIMAKMPSEMVGKNKDLYLAALKNTIPMYSESGKMDPKGADAVLTVFSVGSPEVAKANIDVSKTWTNRFVERAGKTTRSNAK